MLDACYIAIYITSGLVLSPDHTLSIKGLAATKAIFLVLMTQLSHANQGACVRVLIFDCTPVVVAMGTEPTQSQPST